MHYLFSGQLGQKCITCCQDSWVRHILLILRTAWLRLSHFQDIWVRSALLIFRTSWLEVHYSFFRTAWLCISHFQDILVSSVWVLFRTYWLEACHLFSGQLGCAVSPCENNATCQPVPNASPGKVPYHCSCLQGNYKHLMLFLKVSLETLCQQALWSSFPESTHKGVNERSKDVTQRSESPVVTYLACV